MERDTAGSRLYGPQLVFAEKSFKCGYAPRKMLVSQFHPNTIFVGSKDGLVTVLRPKDPGSDCGPLSLDDFEVLPESLEGARDGKGAIQALCEWNESQLLLARSNGSLEVLDWSRPQDPLMVSPGNPKDLVRCLVRLDRRRIAVAYRGTGLTVIDRETGSLQTQKVGDGEPIKGIRAILPSIRGEDQQRFWFLLTDRGDLYQWDGESQVIRVQGPPGPREERAESIWSGGRRPSLVSDYCLLRDEGARREQEPAEEILLATDRGLYVLFFEGQEPSLHRLALSGLNSTPMVLSYTAYPLSTDKVQEYLWVTDLQGDSHLFWGDGSRKGRERSFWRSGVHQSHSETLACALLPEFREGAAATFSERHDPAFFVVQVRRDDRIVLGRYWTPDENLSGRTDGLRKDVMLRELLNFGRYQGASGPRAIRSYLRDRFAEERQFEEEFREDWTELETLNDVAVVAELFEYLAEDEERRQILIESLRAPYAETAQDLLGSDTQDFKYASQLWRLALLGILHRSPSDQTPSYLGLMRWLRHRQVELPAGLPKERLAHLTGRLDVDILLARKWGLQGGVNSPREDLVEPQRILDAQETRIGPQNLEAREELERLRWERLTYRAELFGRSVNLIHEDNEGKLRGRTAWATSVLPGPEHTLVAVSWMWGGVELFSLESVDDQNPKLFFLGGDYGADDGDVAKHVLRRRFDKSRISPAKYGYSRVVHLGKIDGKSYLLSAPAAEPDEGVANLFVWLLEDGEKPGVMPRRIALEGVGRESIYSLLDLGDGRLVAGLRGEGLQAFLALIDLKASGLLPETEAFECVWKIPVSIGPAPTGARQQEEARSPGRNRMWSLARIPEARPGFYRLAFGCDSGEIYEVTIDWNNQSLLAETGPELIGRMGSPVLVLACRDREDGVVRVFAGGEDGAIVAWQELSQVKPESGPSPRFGTLWATVEQGAISQIHLLAVEGQPAVLVVTREGRYVTFDDRAMIDPPPAQKRPSRPSLPGSRHGRRSLRSSAFASSLIQERDSLGSYWKDAAENLGAFAAVLAATDDGRLRLVSLHNPEATRLRKIEYQRIVELWHKVLQEPIHFRLTEAAYKASPALSLIVVRSLLDHTLDEIPFRADPRTVRQALEDSPWSLPRHLRPLFRLRLLWDDLRSSPEAGKPADTKRLERLLSAVLERAWRLDDLDLFQEVCQVVLRRANADLFQAVEAETGKSRQAAKEVASGIFNSVLSAIEHTLPRWLSADRQREARARISVAKHLVDGETARVLIREAAREGKEPQGVPPDPLSFRGVLDERIRSVRELVNKRHPLVSLESLRAANLSLARMCRSLVGMRVKVAGGAEGYEPAKAGEDLENCEVKWDVFRDYSEELVTAAVRAFRTPLELNDALAHEFSRSFALFICACPSATLPIESLLTAQLRISDPEPEKGVFYRVLAQLKVLRAIGIGAPLWADELLRLGTQPPKVGWQWEAKKGEESLPTLARLGVFDYLNRDGDPDEDGDRERLAAKLGVENAENLGNLRRIHGILRKLAALIFNLETTAKGLDLSPEWRDDLLATVNSLDGDYVHSRGFFRKAFEKFPISSSTLPQNLRKVRPETVRLSQPLARWAEERLTDIEQMARDGHLFQPEVTTYARVFRRLERVARDFPTSAAIQTNVVQGILGHHLLEDMDEHALELEEIAEVLNPRRVWEFRDQGRKGLPAPPAEIGPEATAEDFALYLLGRARSAETIPKSLRMLQALLGPTEGDGAGEDPISFVGLVEPFTLGKSHDDDEFIWSKKGSREDEAPLLSPQEARYLALALSELDQNQRKHAWPIEWQGGKRPPEITFSKREEVVLRFWFAMAEGDEKKPDSNFGRLQDLAKSGMEKPIDPKHTRHLASSGTGFYLANLATAIVGWDLILHPPESHTDQGSFQITMTGRGSQA